MTTAVIVLVGAELLAGRRRDTNGAWLAERFQSLGVELCAMHTVGDDPAQIARAVTDGAASADVVVVSGGLGPTQDDRTRAGLALAAGVGLAHDEAAWQSVVACLARRERVPGAAERVQAEVPIGGSWLANDLGVAPGLRVQVGTAEVFAFPGVPQEWRALCEAHLLGDVAGPPPDGGGVIERALWVIGVPEGDIETRLATLPALDAVAVASYPHQGEVELRFRALGAGAAEAVDAAWVAAAAELGSHAFQPPRGGRIEHLVVGALAARSLRIATAESISGGLIARMLTAVPGASAVFPMGWIPYATEQKTAQLGVPAALLAEAGVVSARVACALAEAARAHAGTDLALATTGTAGPGPLLQEGHEPVPAGLVFVALARAGHPTESLRLKLPPDRRLAQRHTAVRALDLVRRVLAE